MSIQVWVPKKPADETKRLADETEPEDGTDVPSITITAPEPRLRRAASDWQSRFGDAKGGLKVPNR